MRHQNRIKKLGRTAAHRKATLAAMASALVEHKRIETTLPKAKALRSFVEPLINRAKEDTTANRRQVFRHLQNKDAVKELFGDISAQVGDRPGGYTRVIKLGLRQGDAAEMAIIELVDYNDVKPDGASSGRKRTRRGSGRGRRKSSGQPKAEQKAPKAAAKATPAPTADDLTKVWGIGPVFAAALEGAGITTFNALAKADLDTLRTAISEGSDTSDASANEETWAAQAALLAAGDTEGHAAYVEQQKAEGGTPHHAAETDADESATDAGEPAETQADDVTETPPAASNPSGSTATGPDAEDAQGPLKPESVEDAVPPPQENPFPDTKQQPHPDAKQGAAPGTGQPPPESHQENQGRGGGHRG